MRPLDSRIGICETEHFMPSGVNSGSSWLGIWYIGSIFELIEVSGSLQRSVGSRADDYSTKGRMVWKKPRGFVGGVRDPNELGLLPSPKQAPALKNPRPTSFILNPPEQIH